MLQLSKQASSALFVLVLASAAAPVHAADTTISGNLTVGSGSAAGNPGTAQLTVAGATPIANRLTYGTDGTGWKFAIGKNQGGTVTDQFTITDGGGVGFGTSSPVAKIEVNDGNGIGAIAYFGASGTNNAKGLYFSRPTVNTNPVNIQGTQFNVGAAAISMQAEGGNVGVGTSSPAYKLHVSAGNMGIDNAREFVMRDTAGNNGGRIGYTAGNDLTISQGNSGSGFDIDFVAAGGTVMKVLGANGNVGVGTTTPTAKLHVAGSVKAESVAMTGTSHVMGAILAAPQGDLPMGSFTSGTVPTVP